MLNVSFNEYNVFNFSEEFYEGFILLFIVNIINYPYKLWIIKHTNSVLNNLVIYYIIFNENRIPRSIA